MKVLFISPHFPREMPEYTRGLAEVGAEVYGLGDIPGYQLPHNVSRYLSGYLHVGSLFNEQHVVDQVRHWMGRAGFDRIECNWEPFVLLAARLREEFGVPGMTYEQVNAFRDKVVMKEKVAAAGLRCPKVERVATAAQAKAAAEKIGFPIIVKPIAGAGSKDTYRVGDMPEFEKVLKSLGHLPEASIEEFIEGEEFTFDAVSIEGAPVFYSIMQYHPKPLEARSNEWISPAQITFANPDQPRFKGAIKLGYDVLRALDFGTGFTHQEWFLTPGGEVVFGEIAGRVGGGGISDMINWANDFDVYREWARAICWHKYGGEPARRYNVAMVFKRAMGQGRITHIEGLDRLRARCGGALIQEALLPIGHQRRNWLDTLISDGWVVVRHPEYTECRSMMEFAINELRLFAA